jgi:hypothetical protein
MYLEGPAGADPPGQLAAIFDKSQATSRNLLLSDPFTLVRSRPARFARPAPAAFQRPAPVLPPPATHRREC